VHGAQLLSCAERYTRSCWRLFVATYGWVRVVLAKHLDDVRMGCAHFVCAAMPWFWSWLPVLEGARLWVPLGFVVNESTRDATFEQRAAPVSFRAALRRCLLLSCLRSHCG